MTVVGFTSLADFLSELRDECGSIADKIVRFEISRTPLQAEGVTFQVDCWATALKKGGDEDWLLEYGTTSGKDCGESPGSEAAQATRDKLAECCDDLGLKLRPGKIEVF